MRADRRGRVPDRDRRDRNRRRGEHPDDLASSPTSASRASSPRRSRQAHGTILERVGAHRVVFPERDMGVRVGHTLTGRTIDYIQLDPGFALVEATAPPRDRRARRSPGPRSGAATGSRSSASSRQAARFTYATPDTVVQEGDILVVAGETRRAEGFSRARAEAGSPARSSVRAAFVGSGRVESARYDHDGAASPRLSAPARSSSSARARDRRCRR